MVYVFLAEGFEEMEAIAPIDVLRRAGADVCVVGAGDRLIEGRNGVVVACDATTDEVIGDDIEGVILPGGVPGIDNLAAEPRVRELCERADREGKLIAAICAAPSLLGRWGLLDGYTAICYPGYENELKGARISDGSVVTDGTRITAKGAGVALEFGLEIVKYFKGEKAAAKIAAGIQKP